MVGDVLSKRYHLYFLSAKILGFEPIIEWYGDDQNFITIYESCLEKKNIVDDYYVFHKSFKEEKYVLYS